MQCNAHVFLLYKIINLDLWPQLMSRTVGHLLTDSVALKWNPSRVASHIHRPYIRSQRGRGRRRESPSNEGA